MIEGLTEEVIARQSPEAQAIIRALLTLVEVQQKRIAQLESEVKQLRTEVKQLRTEVRQLESEGRQLRRRLGDPEPPAATSPGGETPAKETKKAPAKKRKRGGQKGHRRHQRELVPVEDCDEIYSLHPPECRRCGKELTGDDPDPLRHQVFELPEIKLHVTEYQRHRLHCKCCGITTCAELPDDVPTGQSGVRLTMFVALLMAMFRQSKSRVSLFCETLLGHHMSPGLVVKLQNQATESLRPCYGELASKLPKQNVVYADETGTRQQNNNAWIWTTVAAKFTVFTVRLTKAASVIKGLPGETFSGVVVSDRAKTYHWVNRHQWCRAHLKRDFEKMSDRAGEAGTIGQRLLDATHKLFHYCHRIRDGTISQRGFYRQISILRAEVESALAVGRECADQSTAATCRELHNRFENLWVFQYHDNVEPTNNIAERSLRHAVIWKQLSFGTQSDAGSRFVETMLTIIETCRQQKRNLFQFLCDSQNAYLAGKTTPSLCTDP